MFFEQLGEDFVKLFKANIKRYVIALVSMIITTLYWSSDFFLESQNWLIDSAGFFMFTISIFMVCILGFVPYFSGIKHSYDAVFKKSEDEEYTKNLMVKVFSCVLFTLFTSVFIVGLFIVFFLCIDAELMLAGLEIITIIASSINISSVLIFILASFCSSVMTWFLIFLSISVGVIMREKVFVPVMTYFFVNVFVSAPLLNFVISDELIYAFLNSINRGDFSLAISGFYVPYIGAQIILSIVFYLVTNKILAKIHE